MTNLLAVSLLVSFSAAHQQAAQYLQNGRYMEAATLCRDAITHYDPTSLEAAMLLRDLGMAYRGEGSLKKAEAARRQELEILKTRLGEENANVAAATDGLGEIYYEQGRFTMARKAFQEALRIGEKSLDARSPQLATILNDLGAVYQHDGRFADASRMLRRSLAIRESEITRANLERVDQALASRR